MDSGYLKLVELVLLFGGVLAFGVWQLRSVERDRKRRLAAEARATAQAAQPGPAAASCDPPGAADSSGSPAAGAGAGAVTTAAVMPAGVIKSKHSETQSP